LQQPVGLTDVIPEDSFATRALLRPDQKRLMLDRYSLPNHLLQGCFYRNRFLLFLAYSAFFALFKNRLREIFRYIQFTIFRLQS
jgi:hypothetical protein